MSKDSRVKKSIINAKVNMAYYFAILILSFFSRKIFLNNLGADFIGFTSTVSNLLGFLNLAELGISSAIGYVLYKPLFHNDQKRIIEIISVFGFMYRRIGQLILICGLVLSAFLPLIFKNAGINWGIVYFAFYSFLASSLIGYFANYKQTLLAADQRNYIVTAYSQGASIVKICLQMYLAYTTKSPFIWVAIELTFGVLYSFILNWKINSVYPWLRSDIRQGKSLLKSYPEIIRYTKQLFIHKIAGFIQFQTNPFIIYAFASLKAVASYGNYMMIINSLLTLVNKFLGSTEAGIGNLIASGDKNKILKVFAELTALRYYIAGIEIFGVSMLSTAFIQLWVGEEYVLSKSTVVLLSAYIFIMQTRGTNDQFIYGYGLFGDVWAAIAEMSISLLGALALGYLFGLPGVIAGGVTGMFLIVVLWKPYFLFSKGFKISVWNYWRVIIKSLLLNAVAFVSAALLKNLIYDSQASDFIMLAKMGFVSVMLFAAICFMLFYVFDAGMRDFVSRLRHQILKRK